MYKTRNVFTTSALLLMLALLYTACKKSSSTVVDCSTVSNKAFAANVNPIIQNSCNLSGCHAAGSTNGPGALTNYTEVFNAQSSVRSAVSSGRMPKNASLSSSQKNSIVCWIDNGAPNN